MEFFIDVLQMDINRIYVSVFKGEDDIPKDTTSIEIWKSVFSKYGINANVGNNERIQEFGKKKNWWGLATGGPCGPDSEIFLIQENNHVITTVMLTVIAGNM